MRPATTEEFIAWIDAAHAALDSGADLTADHIRALAATPKEPGALQRRESWYLEEMTRVGQNQMRDKFPFGGTEQDVEDWRIRRHRRHEEMQSLAGFHAEALCAATGVSITSAKRKRKTAAELALETAAQNPSRRDAA